MFASKVLTEMSEVPRLDGPKTLWVPSDVAISCEMPQLLLEGRVPVANAMFQNVSKGREEHW